MSNLNTTYPLDPKSDRFRICPFDKVEFMTNHRSRKYCNDFCQDEYHNKKKRDMKLKRNSRLTMKIPKSFKLLNSNNLKVNTNENNIRILDSLNIDNTGKYYHIETLVQYGFKFNFHSGIGIHYNTGEFKSKFLQIGYYKIIRVSFSKILIVKEN